ncbi:MAG: HNH endonuclease [Actinobacteria bacterium]|nr:HNH endonuclease [Actinomycetota bacterium]
MAALRPCVCGDDLRDCHFADELCEVSREEISEFGEPELRRSISRLLRAFVLERDGDRCRACGAVESLEVDHVLPRALGGTNDVENLQALCGPCNRKKGVKLDWVGNL